MVKHGNTLTRGRRKSIQRSIEKQRRTWFSNGDPYSGGVHAAAMGLRAPMMRASVTLPQIRRIVRSDPHRIIQPQAHQSRLRRLIGSIFSLIGLGK